MLANDREAIQQLNDHVRSLEQTIQQLKDQLKIKVRKVLIVGLNYCYDRMMNCLKHSGSCKLLRRCKRYVVPCIRAETNFSNIAKLRCCGNL